MHSCSVVIRAFNEERHIGRLLRGITAQTVEEVEIIVVDSGSTDSTVSIAEDYAARVVSMPPSEFTFGRSLNLGCEQATGDLIVLASAHVYPVYPDWLERLTSPFQDPIVALAYGRQRGTAETHFSESQHFAKLYPASSNADQESAFCNNANAAIRRDLWSSRPYDEKLSGLEDLEWATWAKEEGHRLSYIAEAEVIHTHDETPAQVYNRYRREAIALKRMRPHEHLGFIDFVRLVISNVASDLRHAVQDDAPIGAWPEILWFRIAQFWGTYRGFVHRGPLSSELKQTFYYPRGFEVSEGNEVRTVEPIDYSVEATEERIGD